MSQDIFLRSSKNIGTQGVQELFFVCEVSEIEAFMVQ